MDSEASLKTNNIKSQVDEWLKEYFKCKGTYNKKIYEAMSYSLNVGGKRIRPILMLLTYSMYRDDYKNIIPMACALEMIHTYSLIHDDLPCMDNDDLRRGKPTNHKVFGEAIAVLAGDGLLNEALNVMITYSIENGANALKATELISKAAGVEGMIGGQVVDILSEGKKIPVEELYYMHRKKTGALIKNAVLSGAVLANASKEDLELLEQFGDKLGIAFQIKDDILDVVGDVSKLGKSIKKDVEDNKTNFISVYGMQKCIELSEQLTNECIKILDKIHRDTNSLKELTDFLLKRQY